MLSPSGSGADYNYVTVALYNNFEAMENPFPTALLTQVHPGVNMTEFLDEDKRRPGPRAFRDVAMG